MSGNATLSHSATSGAAQSSVRELVGSVRNSDALPGPAAALLCLWVPLPPPLPPDEPRNCCPMSMKVCGVWNISGVGGEWPRILVDASPNSGPAVFLSSPRMSADERSTVSTSITIEVENEENLGSRERG